MIRLCHPNDFEQIYAIINDAALFDEKHGFRLVSIMEKEPAAQIGVAPATLGDGQALLSQQSAPHSAVRGT